MTKEYLISDFRLGLLDGFRECSLRPLDVPKIVSAPEGFENMMADHMIFWADRKSDNYHRVLQREAYERGYIVGSVTSTFISGFTFGLNNIFFRQTEKLFNYIAMENL